MYRQLQERAKGYVIDTLCQISDKWQFDIDTKKEEEPMIIGYGPDGVIIRATIEKLHLVATKELIGGIANICRVTYCHSSRLGGFTLLKVMIKNIFNIYGINIFYPTYLWPEFKVRSMNGIKEIESSIWAFDISRTPYSYFISPYGISNYVKCENYISAILLLLDPVVYFRRYSDIIQKYPILKKLDHTWGIYELLLEYFPEMNEELFNKYWAFRCVFQDVCSDIVSLVGEILVDLYIC